jgi:hypothetical protein
LFKILLLGLALSTTFSFARAPSPAPDLAEFIKTCHNHRQDATMTEAPIVDKISYIPTWAMEANQGRFSWAALQRKMGDGLDVDTDAYVDKKEDEWVFNFNRGRSFYPSDKAIKGIYYRGRVYIVDGHHRALISTYIGAETIPVRIIADLSKKYSPAKFQEYMADNNLSYNKNYRGAKTSPVDLCDMEDDPNLELARMLVAKADVELVGGKLKIGKLSGEKWILAVKTGEDIAFLEFEIADALRRAGIEWKNSWSAELDKDKLKKFLEYLQNSAKNPNSRLRQVLLFSKPKKLEDIDSDQILKHLVEIGCDKTLRSAQ